MDPRINISWGDWMIEEDNKRRDYYLNLSDEEWKTVVERHLANNKANVRPALAWVERVQRQRVARAEARQQLPREKKTALDITFGAWKDMIEEPWRYGDNDWAEWLEMDQQLRNSPKRWRVDAFWQKKQDEADEASRKAFIQMLVDAKSRFDNRMATRIQAAWRGHRVRDTHPQLNCSRCLGHVPAQYKCEGGDYACHECVMADIKNCAWCGREWNDNWSKFCDSPDYCDPACELNATKEDDHWGGW